MSEERANTILMTVTACAIAILAIAITIGICGFTYKAFACGACP